MKMTYLRFVSLLVALAFMTPAAAAPHWGKFRYDGCVKYKDGHYRVYKAILWGIPWGHSWEVACSKAAATFLIRGRKVHFKRPTVCVKSNVVDALSLTGAVLGVAGVAFPPVGAVGAVVGVGTEAINRSGAGALNMWGVFYVQDPKC